jgi:hypothetical protein
MTKCCCPPGSGYASRLVWVGCLRIGPSIDGGAHLGAEREVRTSYFQIRLTPEERAELEAGADRFGTTVTGLIRKAVKAALTSAVDIVARRARGDRQRPRPVPKGGREPR